MAIAYEEFLFAVPGEQQCFVDGLHHRLLQLGCTLAIKEAKSGYTVSYKWDGKTVLNWVFRKAGLQARVYGDNVGRYESMLADLPASMKKKMTAAPPCKRLLDPTACSDRCVMGFIYNLDGESHQKCRYSGMFFPLNEENCPHIQALVSAEVSARKAGA